jgi:Phage tail protein
MPLDGTLYAGVENTFVYNGLTLNDTSIINKYRITQVNGLNSVDIRDAREVRSGRDGERALSAYYAGRTITLGGRIEALNNKLYGLRVMTTALTGALADLTEKPLYMNQGSLNGWDTQIDCRPSQPLALTDEIKTWYHYRDFMITLRASDPKIVSQALQTSTYTAVGTTASNVALATQNNQGNYKADLVITLTGPMTNPALTLGGSTLAVLGGTTIPGGTSWIIDTKAGTIKTNLGLNRYQYITFTSTMPLYAPGNNIFTFSASGMTAGTSKVKVDYRHTWM